MKRQNLLRSWEALFVLALLSVAVALRSRLTYRTASVDEAIFLVNGWRWLSGQPVSDTARLPGWYPLSFLPLGWAGWWGGVTLARGLNVVFGLLTIALVALVGRRVYGPLAGYLAGFLMAVSGPAIATHTSATNTAGSAMLFALATYLWASGLLDDHGERLAWGSTAAVLSILMCFTAYYTVLACVAVGLLYGLVSSTRIGGARSGFAWAQVRKSGLRKLVLFGLPFAFLPLFVLVYGADASLLQFVRYQLQGIPAVTLRDLFADMARFLWLPILLGLPAVLVSRNRWMSLALATIGLGALPYHLLTRDATTLPQNVAYMTVGLAALAGGSLLSMAQVIQRLTSKWVAMALAVSLGAITVVHWGLAGQRDLAPLRSYWSDVSAAMQYLRGNVVEGDVLLMEGGQVAEYYLIEKGTPGRVPSRVWTTWYYADEQGMGTEAFERAIRDRRFDWIVFDYNYTPELDQRLYGLMADSYELEGSFPARLHGQFGRVEVFKALSYGVAQMGRNSRTVGSLAPISTSSSIQNHAVP